VTPPTAKKGKERQCSARGSGIASLRCG